MYDIDPAAASSDEGPIYNLVLVRYSTREKTGTGPNPSKVVMYHTQFKLAEFIYSITYQETNYDIRVFYLPFSSD